MLPTLIGDVPNDFAIEGGAIGTISPVDRMVALKFVVPLKKTICANCEAVRPEALEPTKILPAVPEVPSYPPVHPEIVRVFAAVHETPLLTANVIEWLPVPRAIFELSERVRVPVDCVKPAVAPDANVPPLRTSELPLGMVFAAPQVNVPELTVVAPEYAFAPERVAVPPPVFVIAFPLPEIRELRIRAEPLSMLTFPVEARVIERFLLAPLEMVKLELPVT